MGGVLGDPSIAVADDHRCDAIGGPRLISPQQQDLMCLRSAHVDCPRYRRAIATAEGVRGGRRAPSVPRAIAASLVILALAAGISFGFVMARGGIDLPASAGASALAANRTAAPTPKQTPDLMPQPTLASLAPSSEPTSAPEPTPSAPASGAPTPSSSEAPAPSPTPTPQPTATPLPSGGPSAARLAVLKPCPNQSGCYLYAIRAGDNLFSIAHWFGVPLDTIYSWNPTLKKTGIHPGMVIKIPTPTR